MSFENPEAEAALLDLAHPRTIILQDRSRKFVIQTRHVEEADWLAYFSAIRITSEQHGAERVNTMDFDSPRVQLAERVIVNVLGYHVAGGGKLQDIENWQARLPLAHRKQVGATLADVRPSASLEDFVIQPEGEEVLLDAVWSANTRAGIVMQKFTGLKHIFKTPTAAQHKRYNQEASRSIVVGGSRTGQTIYAGAQALLCQLYNELIVSVEGYGLHGVPLDRKEVVAAMDLHHKFTAAQELFAPSGSVALDAEVSAE